MKAEISSMDAYELSLPWFTSFTWIFAIFTGGLAAFHILFIYATPLSPIWWKRVDYMWLSMALLGLLGSVGTSREIVARNMFDLESHRVKSGWHFVEQTAGFGTSIGVCRQFIRSESSPPADEFEKLQQSYNAQCEWFKNASSVLRSLQNGGTTAIDAVALFGPVPESEDRQIYQSFLNAITTYNSTLAGAQELKQQATRSSFEEVVRLLGPALIALALALRMTKVTVEIKNEQKKN